MGGVKISFSQSLAVGWGDPSDRGLIYLGIKRALARHEPGLRIRRNRSLTACLAVGAYAERRLRMT
jgi:hypothetical protein